VSHENDKSSTLKTSFLSRASEKIGIAAIVLFGCFMASAFLPYSICLTIAFYSALFCMAFSYTGFIVGICALIAIFISKRLKGYRHATIGILSCVVSWFLLGVFYHPWLEKKRAENANINTTAVYKEANP
jgi:ABC-type uncharacterized transport system permease subunit